MVGEKEREKRVGKLMSGAVVVSIVLSVFAVPVVPVIAPEQPPLLDKLILSADPDEIPADGVSNSTLTAVVYDTEGDPVANVPVYFEIVSGNGTITDEYGDPNDGLVRGNPATATLTAGTTPGPVKIRAYTTSPNYPENYTTVMLTEVAKYRVKLIPDEFSKETYANENATYYITVENTGTERDTYNLSITANEADYAWLNKTLVSLGAGESEVVELNVRDSSPGSYNTTVEATSANASANVTVMTIVRSPMPDLMVTEIELNCGYLFANESNEICAVIKNNGIGDALSFNVSFIIGGFSKKERVDGLAAGANTTICITDPTKRNADDSVTIIITADCDNEINETNEMNNDKSTEKIVVNNGYKGKRYTGGEDVSTWRTYELNGSVLYSVGDSYYLSAWSYPNWTKYTVNWSASDLPVPPEATVVEARLYVIYTWDKAGVMPDEVSLTFNGQMQTLEAHYSDRKGYGENDYPYGMLVYNVTDVFNTSGNTAILNNTHTGGGNVSIRGMLLVVIYADDSEPKRTIFMNEGFDMLYGGSSKCTTPEEATAYAPFSGLTVDTANVTSAKLITVAPGAGPNEGDLIFNGHKWTDVWNFAGSSQIGINEIDVTAYLNATENEARFQSSEDWMEASNAFLVVTKGVPLCIPRPFLINGYVFYANGAACNGPIVSITNLNTGKTWEAETNATSNYYQLNLTSCVDVNASEVLQFNVSSPDKTRTNTTEYMVTQADIDAGGLFNFNITLRGIHDINITTDYEGAVNGIKITRDGTDVVGPDENLTIGKTYKIRYKLVNEGDFNETVHVTVRVANESWSMLIGEHNYSLDAGESSTYKDEWNTSGLAPGDYTITVNASIPDDAHPDDNKRTRVVTLMSLPPFGSIIGRITYTCNETGIAEVHVNLTKDGEVLDTTTTNNTGYYEFIDINPGDYYVNASKPGFWDNSTSVTVIAGEKAIVNMMLWIIGDLDNNGKSADRDDVILMLKAYLGFIEPDYRYDLDKDGSPADRDDVILMLKAYLGYIVLSNT